VLRISGGRAGELARMADRPLHALVRGREAPEIKRMAIRSTVRGARSVPRTVALEPRDPQGDSTKLRHSRRGERRLEALS